MKSSIRTCYLRLLLLAVAFLAACSDSTGPETFSISGAWTSVGFAGADFAMTVVETARAVEGAGYVIIAGEATAYRVYGANAGQRASLLLDFDGSEDINFEGEFERQEDAVVLVGFLFGGGYSGEPITFQRDQN